MIILSFNDNSFWCFLGDVFIKISIFTNNVLANCVNTKMHLQIQISLKGKVVRYHNSLNTQRPIHCLSLKQYHQLNVHMKFLWFSNNDDYIFSVQYIRTNNKDVTWVWTHLTCNKLRVLYWRLLPLYITKAIFFVNDIRKKSYNQYRECNYSFQESYIYLQLTLS